jgi:hypothetical protein
VTAADRHRADADRLRRAVVTPDAESFFGFEIWQRLATLHEEIAARLDEVTATQSDMPAFEDIATEVPQ